MTKPSTKADKPARELAAKGDTSNEGAQAARTSTRAAVRRLIDKANDADAPVFESSGYRAGWIAACDAVLAYLNKQTERFSVRKGGLRGPGKGARRAQ